MVFRLANFSEFIEVAEGCQHVFFKREQLDNKKVKLWAYAGRVMWKGELKAEETESKLDELKLLRAKEVLEDVEIERVLR